MIIAGGHYFALGFLHRIYKVFDTSLPVVTRERIYLDRTVDVVTSPPAICILPESRYVIHGFTAITPSVSHQCHGMTLVSHLFLERACPWLALVMALKAGTERSYGFRYVVRRADTG